MKGHADGAEVQSASSLRLRSKSGTHRTAEGTVKGYHMLPQCCSAKGREESSDDEPKAAAPER